MSKELEATRRDLDNEVFAFRHEEQWSIHSDLPALPVRFVGIMMLPVTLPGLKAQRDDKYGVRDFAVVCCESSKDGRWKWVVPAPPTKEMIGVMMEEAACKMNLWYWLCHEK